MRPVSGIRMNSVMHRVGLPTLETTEEFITRTPANHPDITDDIKEWFNKTESFRCGVFKIKRSRG
jgi:hypothetical protein